MNEHLRDRILRKLETLSEERAYQALDYIEFLSSKYAERPAPVTANVFTRFTEAVEDRLRAGKVSSSAIAETMGLMNRAVKVLDGISAAGRSVATDLAGAATTAWGAPAGGGAPGGSGTPAGSGAPAGKGAGGEPPVPPPAAGSGPATTANETDSGEINPPGVTPAMDGGGAGTDINPGRRT